MRRIKDFRRSPQAFQNLAPKPFARINAAALGEILRAHFFGERGDFAGFVDAGVVFPQPRHRGGIVRKSFLERERLTGRVNRKRRAAGRVHADADDLVGTETFHGFLRRGECLLDGDFRAIDVIRRVLPRQIRIARKDDTLRAVRVSPDGGGDLRAVGDVDNQGSNRVRAVIQADGVLSFHRVIYFI